MLQQPGVSKDDRRCESSEEEGKSLMLTVDDHGDGSGAMGDWARGKRTAVHGSDGDWLS